jgi:hypothetical protein
MIGATPLLAMLAAVPAAPPPVQLRAFDCPGLNEADVRRALAIELKDRLLVSPAPAPPDFLVAEIACPGSDLVVTVARVNETTAPARWIRGAAADGSAGARTVALAIAEQVRAADAPKPPAVEPPPTPAPSPDPTPDTTMITSIGVAGEMFSSGGTPLGGAELRWSFLWAKFRGHLDSPWTFGPTVPLDIMAASFWSGAGSLTTQSLGFALMGQRQTGHFRPELAIGNRYGLATFKNESGPAPTVRRATVASYLEVGLAFVAGRTYVQASITGNLPLTAPSSYCSTQGCVDFSGSSLLASLKLGVMN